MTATANLFRRLAVIRSHGNAHLVAHDDLVPSRWHVPSPQRIQGWLGHDKHDLHVHRLSPRVRRHLRSLQRNLDRLGSRTSPRGIHYVRLRPIRQTRRSVGTRLSPFRQEQPPWCGFSPAAASSVFLGDTPGADQPDKRRYHKRHTHCTKGRRPCATSLVNA